MNIKRRSFIQQCAVIGVALGLASQEVTGEVPGNKRRPIRPSNRSVAGIGNVPPRGEVAAISGPGTDAPNTMSDVMYLIPAGPGSGTGGNYFANWCSGVYAPDDGIHGSMLFCNGGDGDYWGNEVYKFSLDTRIWSRESERSIGLTGVTTAGGDRGFDETWGEHAGGAPGVPHSYDQMEYLPPTLGGGAKGAFLFPTRTIVYRTRKYFHPHFFDLDAKKWHRGSAFPNITSYGGTMGPDEPTWCFDASRGRFWGISGGDGGLWNSRLQYLDFDPATRLATAGFISIPRQLTPYMSPVSRRWPAGDLMLVIGLNRALDAIQVIACPLATPTAGFSPINLTGDTIPAGKYGLAYCDDLDCFFVRMAAGFRQTIWKLTPPKSSYLTRAWAVEKTDMGGATVGATDHPQGMWKRFMYAPPLKCLIWVDDVKGAVYAYRPVGT